MKNLTKISVIAIAALSLSGCITADLTIAGGNSYIYAPNSYILKIEKGGYTNITVTGHAGMVLATNSMPNEVKTFCDDESNEGKTIARSNEIGETISLTCPSN